MQDHDGPVQSDTVFLNDICYISKHQVKAKFAITHPTIRSGYRSDTRPNALQLLPQLHPHALLQLSAFLSLAQPFRWCDLAIRHVLAVRFRADGCAVHERTGAHLGWSGEDLHEEPGEEDVLVFAAESAGAESRRR